MAQASWCLQNSINGPKQPENFKTASAVHANLKTLSSFFLLTTSKSGFNSYPAAIRTTLEKKLMYYQATMGGETTAGLMEISQNCNNNYGKYATEDTKFVGDLVTKQHSDDWRHAYTKLTS